MFLFSFRYFSSRSVYRIYMLKEASIYYCQVSNTRKSVVSDFQTPRSGLKKRNATVCFFFFFFNQLLGIWKSNETLFRVFDIASRTIFNSCRNSKQKFNFTSYTVVIPLFSLPEIIIIIIIIIIIAITIIIIITILKGKLTKNLYTTF